MSRYLGVGMKRLRLVLICLLLAGLAACGSEKATAMPDVKGQRLDVALSDIERAGVEEEVEVLGGGLFGVIDESNWQVCEQLPAAGQTVTDAPRLTVERVCEADTDPAEAAPEATSPTPSPATSPDTTDARAIEKAFQSVIPGLKIKDMCDASYTHWACFYEGVGDSPGDLQVRLTTDGGWSDADLETLAEQAGRHWFNFIGCKFRDLNAIVVTVNGVDYNVYRSDVRPVC